MYSNQTRQPSIYEVEVSQMNVSLLKLLLTVNLHLSLTNAVLLSRFILGEMCVQYCVFVGFISSCGLFPSIRSTLNR